MGLARERHRYRVPVKSPRAFDLSAAPKLSGGIKREVDIDPMSFY